MPGDTIIPTEFDNRMRRRTFFLLLVFWLAAGVAGVAGLLRWRDGVARPQITEVSSVSGAAVPDFSLTDQDGRPARLADLRGRIWIGAFIYTRCPDICPMMARTLSSLQNALADPDIMLVSFSVDPEHDTPAILKSYADKLGADAHRWRLLTGGRAEIERVSRGMLLGLTASTQPGEINHSDRFVLVGRDGRVQGYYSAMDEKEIDRLKADIAKLTGQPPLGGTPAP